MCVFFCGRRNAGAAGRRKLQTSAAYASRLKVEVERPSMYFIVGFLLYDRDRLLLLLSLKGSLGTGRG